MRARLVLAFTLFIASSNAFARDDDVEACARAHRTCVDDVRAAAESDPALLRARERRRRAPDSRDDGVDFGDHGIGVEGAGVTSHAEAMDFGCCLFATNERWCDNNAMDWGSANASERARAKTLGAEVLFNASARFHAKARIAALELLSADARACAPPKGATTCDEALIEAYARAGESGAEVGFVRAGEWLIRRYGAGLATRVNGKNATEECDQEVGGNVTDAARARKLFKRLLASDAYDALASRRLKELHRAEQMWVDPKFGGTPDEAYVMASFVVRWVGGFVALVVASVATFAFRRTRFVRWTIRTFLRVTLIAFAVDTASKAAAFIAFLRGPKRKNVADSRQTRRLEAKRAAKIAKHHHKRE